MNEPTIRVTRAGEVPVEQYGQAKVQWLASKAANGARELMFGVTDIEVGGSSPMHRHPNCEEVLHLLEGEIDQVIEGGHRLRMAAGDTITIPRDLKHQAINVGDTPARMFVAFSSPERQTIIEELDQRPAGND